MLKRSAVLACLAVFIVTQVAVAETADYHLKRLEIQAKAFLAQLGAKPDAGAPEAGQPNVVSGENLEEPVAAASVDEQLENTVEAPTWAENMVREDLEKLLATSQNLRAQLKEGDTEEYLKAKVELESLARRLRISTSPLELTPQQTANLELMMLELEESSNSVTNTREAILTRQQARRHRSNINIGLGLGYGWGYGGAFSPWGYSPWGFGGYGPFFRRGYLGPRRRLFRRRGCR